MKMQKREQQLHDHECDAHPSMKEYSSSFADNSHSQQTRAGRSPTSSSSQNSSGFTRSATGDEISALATLEMLRKNVLTPATLSHHQAYLAHMRQSRLLKSLPKLIWTIPPNLWTSKTAQKATNLAADICYDVSSKDDSSGHREEAFSRALEAIRERCECHEKDEKIMGRKMRGGFAENIKRSRWFVEASFFSPLNES